MKDQTLTVDIPMSFNVKVSEGVDGNLEIHGLDETLIQIGNVTICLNDFTNDFNDNIAEHVLEFHSDKLHELAELEVGK